MSGVVIGGIYVSTEKRSGRAGRAIQILSPIAGEKMLAATGRMENGAFLADGKRTEIALERINPHGHWRLHEC